MIKALIPSAKITKQRMHRASISLLLYVTMQILDVPSSKTRRYVYDPIKEAIIEIAIRINNGITCHIVG